LLFFASTVSVTHSGFSWHDNWVRLIRDGRRTHKAFLLL